MRFANRPLQTDNHPSLHVHIDIKHKAPMVQFTKVLTAIICLAQEKLHVAVSDVSGLVRRYAVDHRFTPSTMHTIIDGAQRRTRMFQLCGKSSMRSVERSVLLVALM